MRKHYFQKEDLSKITRFKRSLLQSLSAGGFIAILFLFPQLSQAQNQVQGEKFIVEPPTLENLGFEWYIDGDDNRNATVKVEYRKAESGNEWKEGMPLLRIGGEHIERAGIDYTTPHMFAGSILDLNIGTGYEARFTLEDPDGVDGEAVKVVSVATRAEPKAYRQGRVRHIFPILYR